MHTDDVPVIGENPTEQRDERRGRGRLVAFVAVLAAVSVVAVGVSGDGFEPAVPLPDPEPVTTTTRPDSKVVDDTLAWEETVGLEEAWHIAEVLELGESVLAVGTTEDGLAVWESDDGIEWSPAIQLSSRSGDSTVVGAVVDGGHPVIVENFAEPPPDPSGVVMWSRGKSGDWTAHELNGPGPSTTVTARGVGMAGNQIVVVGFSNWRFDPAPAMAALEAETAELVTTGQATLTVGVGMAGLVVEPDRLVYSIELDVEPRLAPTRSMGSLTWTGQSAAEMSVTGLHTVTEIVGPVDDGRRLVGRSAGQSYVTSDGRTWTPVTLSSVRSPASWSEDLVVLADDRRRVLQLDVDSGDVAVLSPPDDLVDEQPRLSGLAAGEVGISALELVPEPSPHDVHTVVGGDDDTIVQLSGHSGLEIHHRGDVVFDGTVHTAPISLDPDTGHLIFTDPIGGQPVLRLEVDQWLSGVGLHALTSGPRPAAKVIHTPDGRVWSSIQWSEMGGEENPLDPALIATDEFVLAVDQGTEEGPVMGAWIGRPAD